MIRRINQNKTYSVTLVFFMVVAILLTLIINLLINRFENKGIRQSSSFDIKTENFEERGMARTYKEGAYDAEVSADIKRRQLEASLRRSKEQERASRKIIYEPSIKEDLLLQ